MLMCSWLSMPNRLIQTGETLHRTLQGETSAVSNFKSSLFHLFSLNTSLLTNHISFSSQTYHPSHPMVQHFNNHKKSLNPSQFYNVLYQRLLAVQNERQAHKKQAANIAREAGKKYEEIMVSQRSYT